MPNAHNPEQNHLLAALPADDFERLLPHLELAPLPLGWTIHGSGHDQRYVYFPTTAIVSLLYVLEDGSSMEMAAVGNDGLIGIALLMGGETTPTQAMVPSAGHGYRLKAEYLKREFDRGDELQRLLLRYAQGLMTQIAQTAVCNRHHSIEQQVCRWLLLSLDRLNSNELKVTHELIAKMLGVRREGVTGAAGNLQKNGLINCKRGHITVENRSKLEARVCECYAVVKKEMGRLLPRARPFKSFPNHDIGSPIGAQPESHTQPYV